MDRKDIHDQRIKPGSLPSCIGVVRLAGVSEVVSYPVAGDDDKFDVLHEEGAEGFGPGEIYVCRKRGVVSLCGSA